MSGSAEGESGRKSQSAINTGKDLDPLAPAGSEARRRRSRVAIALNVLGCALGLALLWWCGARALSASNRDQLALLWRAPWWQAAGLVGVSLLNAVCSAMVSARPSRPCADSRSSMSCA